MLRNRTESDLEQILEDAQRRLSDPESKKELLKELARDAARPGLTDDIEQLAQEFRLRLRAASRLPPGVPREYEEAFSPFLERMVASLPPLEREETITFDLWTQHMVYFHFGYGMDSLKAMLERRAFAMLAPSPGQFQQTVSDPNDSERSKKTDELVNAVIADVIACVGGAFEMFVDALRGRLGSLVEETLNEIIIRSISDLLPKMNNVANVRPADLRKLVIGQWQDIEKTRLGTPPAGAPTFKTAEEAEALIRAAKEKLTPSGLENNKTAVVEYIKLHYPSVRCSSVKQLNRLIERYGLTDKIPFERDAPQQGKSRKQTGQKSK